MALLLAHGICIVQLIAVSGIDPIDNSSSKVPR
jgi:hypothetical protein